MVQQTCTSVTVEFDDEAVADFYDDQVDAGLKPEQFGRIWIHTHPGISAEPSGTDEATFDRSFGLVDWAVMLILAKGGETYSRLRFNAGPTCTQRMRVLVDFEAEFAAVNHDEWQAEYRHNVTIIDPWSPVDTRPETWLIDEDADSFDSHDDSQIALADELRQNRFAITRRKREELCNR